MLLQMKIPLPWQSASGLKMNGWDDFPLESKFFLNSFRSLGRSQVYGKKLKSSGKNLSIFMRFRPR